MYKTEDIMAAAISIRPNLKDLIGEEAENIQSELADLLLKHEKGEDVEIEVIDLLSGNETTRKWMENELKDKRIPDGEKSFKPLAGHPVEPPRGIEKFVCSKGCGFTWFRQRVGQEIPNCSKCGAGLVSEK